MTRGEGLRRLEEEIQRARAEALGRAGERLENALRHLMVLERAVAAVRDEGGAVADGSRRLAAALAARDHVRAEARRLRHYLLIQREALGLAGHPIVDEVYRLPKT